MLERETERIVAAAASGDEQAIGDAIAASQEHLQDGASSGEILAGLAIFHMVYQDEFEEERLVATLQRFTPRDLIDAAQGITGPGYPAGGPATASELAERVAFMVTILYNGDPAGPLDEKKMVGHGRTLLPDLEWEGER